MQDKFKIKVRNASLVLQFYLGAYNYTHLILCELLVSPLCRCWSTPENTRRAGWELAQPREERAINPPVTFYGEYIVRLRILKLVYVCESGCAYAFFLSVSQPSFPPPACFLPLPLPILPQKISFHWAFIAALLSQSRLFSGA